MAVRYVHNLRYRRSLRRYRIRFFGLNLRQTLLDVSLRSDV